jgi:hypothetical protein
MIVVAANVEIHAAAKPLFADQRMDHAHQFGALVVDGRRVEIVDADIAVRPYRMGEWAVILGELDGADAWHVEPFRNEIAARQYLDLAIAESGNEPVTIRRAKAAMNAGSAIASPPKRLSDPLARDGGCSSRQSPGDDRHEVDTVGLHHRQSRDGRRATRSNQLFWSRRKLDGDNAVTDPGPCKFRSRLADQFATMYEHDDAGPFRHARRITSAKTTFFPAPVGSSSTGARCQAA